VLSLLGGRTNLGAEMILVCHRVIQDTLITEGPGKLVGGSDPGRPGTPGDVLVFAAELAVRLVS
jgi:hypothetical protein